MNTIQVTTESGAVINYTEAEVLRFINKAGELEDVYEKLGNSFTEIRNIKYKIRDFFMGAEWDNGTQEVLRDDVNLMLESIGAPRIPSKFNATVTVTLTVKDFESDDAEELADDIENSLDVRVSDGNVEVYSVDVSDVEECE